MPRFNSTTQKYDSNGNKVPKGLNGIKKHLEDNPDIMIFDSKAEYELYIKLNEMEKAGKIKNLTYKQKFTLVGANKWFNNVKEKQENIRELCYITDFVFERNGKKVVLDCKGWKLKKDKKTGKEKWSVYYDEIYKLKKKMFIEKYKDEYVFEEL
jgi:hypothetical protein